MRTYLNPPKEQWEALCARARKGENSAVLTTVRGIMDRVRKDGDRALVELASEIDGVSLGCLRVSREEIREALESVDPQLFKELQTAAGNIRSFHQAQLPKDIEVETFPGVKCLQRAIPIERVGLYIPGGTAPLFSTVLMLAIPAKVAGCSKVVLCTPTDKDGKVSREVLCAASLCGVDEIYKAGGAQAIAAMAYGTESVPKVDKIFGPGNRYVMAAKQLVASECCAIDMPAGPSEVMVIADSSASPEYAAADMLSQAEHGPDSQAMLVCDSEEFAKQVAEAIERQAATLSRGRFIASSLEESRAIVLASREEMMEFSNLYAPEHLILSVENPWEMASMVRAAGSVFVGCWSPESAGDYASGTNHTLPTSAWARSYSGVNTESFMRRTTFQELSRSGLEGLASTICTMAQWEGLDAHANAVKVRIDGGNK